MIKSKGAVSGFRKVSGTVSGFRKVPHLAYYWSITIARYLFCRFPDARCFVSGGLIVYRFVHGFFHARSTRQLFPQGSSRRSEIQFIYIPSPQLHHFILAKLLKFQETFPEKFLVSGFGADAPRFNTYIKSTALPCFLCFVMCWNCVPNLRFKGLLKKPLKNPQNFHTDYTTLFWRSF